LEILVDSREQTPLDFPFKQVSNVGVTKLEVGDYACKCNDTVLPVIFERKSKGDLFGTLGKGHKRFRKELQRALDNHIELIIIIECSLISVLEGFVYKAHGGQKRNSKVKGTAIAQTLFTLWVKYGVLPVFCSSREEMSNYIYGTFLAMEKQFKKGK